MAPRVVPCMPITASVASQIVKSARQNAFLRLANGQADLDLIDTVRTYTQEAMDTIVSMLETETPDCFESATSVDDRLQNYTAIRRETLQDLIVERTGRSSIAPSLGEVLVVIHRCIIARSIRASEFKAEANRAQNMLLECFQSEVDDDGVTHLSLSPSQTRVDEMDSSTSWGLNKPVRSSGWNAQNILMDVLDACWYLLMGISQVGTTLCGDIACHGKACEYEERIVPQIEAFLDSRLGIHVVEDADVGDERDVFRTHRTQPSAWKSFLAL